MLDRANTTNEAAPQAPDTGAPEDQAPAPAPASAPANAAAAPAAAAKKPTEDTFIKVKLSADRAARDTWLKQVAIRADGVREFSDGKITAFTHPRFTGVKLYNQTDKDNYFAGDAPSRHKGLIGRFEFFMSKTTDTRPVSKPGIVGDIHMGGLIGAEGKAKPDAIRVFGEVVGKDKAVINTALQDNATRAKEFKARTQSAGAPAPAGGQPAPAPTDGAVMDMDFGM
jgi:hypothetical protein